MTGQEIDWSAAPADATHYHPENKKFYFVDEVGAIYMAGQDARYGKVHAPKAWRERLIARPTVVEWDGEGLPPVGCRVEYRHKNIGSNSVSTAVVLYASSQYLIVMEDDGSGEQHYFTDRMTLRPARTAEEIATEEALAEIERLYSEGGPAAVYDAGYRKVAEEKVSDE